MGSISVGERNKMLDAVTGRASYTAPAAFFAQLHTADPGAAGTTAVGTGARTAVTFGSAASAGSISNTADALLPSGATQTITHVSFWSASSGGTFLGSDDIASAAVDSGDEIKIAAGGFVLSLA